MNLFEVTGNEDSALIDYIDKDVILQYTSEEKIFSLVFGYEPEEYEYVVSPFRDDDNPGAYFETYYYDKDTSKLLFKDWGDPNKRLYDCFDAVQVYYGLPNFKSTLQFIKANLLDGKPLIKRERVENKGFKINNSRTIIQCSTRTFDLNDKNFWEPYGITSQQLKEDRVFRASRYFIQKPNEELKTLQICYSQTYVYAEFKSGNKKLYTPYKKNRFITNCNQNDIGGLLTLIDPSQNDTLIITKSYKDCRVLRNLGYNSIWFQSENIFPDKDLIIPIIKDYRQVIIFFDNDETGVKSAEKYKHEIFNLVNSVVTTLHLPFYLLDEKIKDASDMYKHKGKEELENFLNSNI